MPQEGHDRSGAQWPPNQPDTGCARGSRGADIGRGLKLDSTGQRAAGGCLYFQTAPLDYSLPTSLPAGKADNQILGVVAALSKEHAPREVVLVSKDINMRVKGACVWG